MQNHVFIPGPLHPDLFGGETPIMMPCELPPALFSVEVCWPADGKIECEMSCVVARTHEEAARSASRRSTRTDAEVVGVERKSRRPSRRELEAWTREMEVRR